MFTVVAQLEDVGSFSHEKVATSYFINPLITGISSTNIRIDSEKLAPESVSP